MSERPDDDFLITLRETPRPEFAAQLAARLGQVTNGQLSTQDQRPRGRRMFAVSIAAVVLLAIGITFLLHGPHRTHQESAQQVLQRVAAVNVNDLGVQTWHLRIESDIYNTPPTSSRPPIVVTSEWWAAAPNRWRVDFRVSAPPFLAHTDQLSGSVSDGVTEWSYNPADPGYDIQIGALPAGATFPPLRTIALPAGNLQAGQAVGGSNAQATPTSSQAFLACYPQAILSGTAIVAGRETYVIDLGPDTCSPGTRTVAGTTMPQPTVPPGQQGRQTMWVDKQWSVLLKLENVNPDGSLRIHTEATIFEVNQSIADRVFTFEPPAEITDAHTADLRPQPYRPPASVSRCAGCISPGIIYPIATVPATIDATATTRASADGLNAPAWWRQRAT